MMLELVEIGAKVTVGEHEATVLDITIHSNHHIQYRVVWWDQGRRVAEYVEACEVEPLSDERIMCMPVVTTEA